MTQEKDEIVIWEELKENHIDHKYEAYILIMAITITKGKKKKNTLLLVTIYLFLFAELGSCSK